MVMNGKPLPISVVVLIEAALTVLKQNEVRQLSVLRQMRFSLTEKRQPKE